MRWYALPAEGGKDPVKIRCQPGVYRLFRVGEDERRVGINENLFREVNERIEELGERLDVNEAEFFCECGDRNCAARLTVSTRQYEAVRAHSDRFLVVAGHELPRLERVVEDHGRYVVVEKQGEAGKIAEDTDPGSG